MKAPRSFLKIYEEDPNWGNPTPLYYHKRTVSDPEAMPDEWIVEKIISHRENKGKLEFLTRWKGFSPLDDSWEPVGNFIHRYSSDLVKYCQDKNIRLDLTK